MTESQKYRKFVEANLEGVFFCDSAVRAPNPSFGHAEWLVSGPHAKRESEAWEYAYDVVIERLEAIRQIEEEMQIVARDVHNKSSWSRSLIKRGLADKARKIAIQGCRSARTLARLEAWRDEMKRGMKPTATQKDQP